MIQLGDDFKTDDRSRHSDWLRQQRWFIKSRHEQVRRDDIADKQEQSTLSLAADVIMATEIQIEKFKVKLDTYDEATVKALMENRQTLDLVNAQLEDMLERAYVMEDGRRVFRTEDGTQVFDESGKEISRGELDPGLIRSDQPTWESFSEGVERLDKLETERGQILEFQEKVDAAREQIANGKITKDELDDLGNELSDAVPPSVGAHISDFAPPEDKSIAKTTFTPEARQPVASANLLTP